MSETTKIEWCDRTFNPWIGCTKVSPGCANCYAESEDKRRGWTPAGWGKGKPRKLTSGLYWKQALKWDRDCAERNSWHRPRVFPSLCDWLDEEVPIEWLADFLNLIRITPHLAWLLLTKRPELFAGRLTRAMKHIENSGGDPILHAWILDWITSKSIGDPPSNVWLGVSVEDQDRAEDRIRRLLDTPAHLRFLSVEPLLGPVNLRHVNSTPSLSFDALAPSTFMQQTVDWVIVGGESGPKARPCDIGGFRSLVEQCRGAKKPIFVKQLGAKPEFSTWPTGGAIINYGETRGLKLEDRKGGDPAEWPEDLRVRQMPSLLGTASQD